MSTSDREPKLIHVRRPLKRMPVTTEPGLPHNPAAAEPLIHVRRPLKRVELAPDTSGAAVAVAFIRRHLVAPTTGRPLARLSALVNEAARITEARVVLADETGTANRDVWGRFGAVLAGVCAEVPDAALDPELYETVHTMLVLWAVGQDLADSARHRPQVRPFLGAYHREVRAIFQALAC